MPEVVIIGAGVGGLTAAFGLKRDLGVDDIVIYERSMEAGGTWHNNTYPGAASDIHIHLYSLSYAPNPDWEHAQAYSKEIKNYWLDLAHNFDVYRRIRFGKRVVSAEWDAKRSVWNVVAEDVDGKEGSAETTTAKVLINAVGILDVPQMPNIPGIDSFKGTIFHSAQWRGDVTLSGKRVAVIGNGASATQFVPRIAQDHTTQVTSFCRTPGWYVSSAQYSYSPLAKWAFRWLPLVMWLHRLYYFVLFELWYLFLFSSKTSFMRGWLTKSFVTYIKEHAPAEYHQHMIPNFNVGCKRILFDTHYFKSLHRPNHKMNWDGIAEINGNGIKTKTGQQLPFDVIICSTGFVTDKFPIPIRGANGQTIQEYYDEVGYPNAYKATSLPGFPNMCIMTGPGITTGHISIAFSDECQMAHIVKLLRPVLAPSPNTMRIASVDVTRAATVEYNAWLEKRLERTVHTGCVSWYRTGDGKGRISSIFPGSATRLWWLLRDVRWEDYEVEVEVEEGI